MYVYSASGHMVDAGTPEWYGIYGIYVKYGGQNFMGQHNAAFYKWSWRKANNEALKQ